MKDQTREDKALENLKWLAFGVPTEVLLETWKHQRKLIDDWPTVHDHWIDLNLSLMSKYSKEELASKHLFLSYLTLLRNLAWHTTAVLSGAYESAARELRYLLEETCQALYLDATYPGRAFEEVYDIIRRNRPPRGRELIRSLRLPGPVKSEMCEVYDRLNEYVHPSRKMLLENITDLKVVLFYNGDLFLNIQRLHRQVTDFILYVMLSAFPLARDDFLNKPYVRANLERMGSKMTLEGHSCRDDEGR